MLPEDQKRLDREASIAKATKGGDYSRLEKEISNAKSEHAKNSEAQAEIRAREQRGIRMTQSYYKSLERSASGFHKTDKPNDQGQEQ